MLGRNQSNRKAALECFEHNVGVMANRGMGPTTLVHSSCYDMCQLSISGFRLVEYITGRGLFLRRSGARPSERMPLS
jgi:hypothetical protein